MRNAVYMAMSSGGEPSVSVIIPSYNRRERLRRLLSELERHRERGSSFEDVVAVGCFDERFTREEDVELAHRLAARGVSFHFLPEAVVHHDPDRTFEVWLNVAFDRGRKDVLLERELDPADRSLPAEWHRRHRLNRMLARWSIGHADRTRLVVAALRRALGAPSPRARRLVCSALFNVK